MSLKELQEDFNKIIKPQLEEILNLLKNQQNADNIKDNIEAAAAKTINEIKTIIHDCPCNKEILDALSTGTSKNKEVVSVEYQQETKTTSSGKYSYPNFCVGNEELGTGKNPGSLTWPFGVDKKST